MEAQELRQVVGATGGHYYPMGDEDAVRGIVDAVQAQEATAIDAASRTLYSDNPAVPMAFAGVGLVGLLVAGRRWAS